MGVMCRLSANPIVLIILLFVVALRRAACTCLDFLAFALHFHLFDSHHALHGYGHLSSPFFDFFVLPYSAVVKFEKKQYLGYDGTAGTPAYRACSVVATPVRYRTHCLTLMTVRLTMVFTDRRYRLS